MRSLGFTLILALFAAAACGLASWQWVGGNFDSLLGVPPTPVGKQLYPDFSAADVKHIEVLSDGVTASFSLGENGWRASTPWDDRMDPRVAVKIINFTLGMRVEDLARVDDVDRNEVGLGDSSISIRLEGKSRGPLAFYKIGRPSPWLATVKDIDEPVPTVFVQPRDEDRKYHVYTSTGDISELFKNKLAHLRDHHPFYFNPVILQKIRIRAEEGELTLGRESPEKPWRVVKPLDLATDPVAMKTLIEGLFELQALKISDRASLPLPDTNTLTKTRQIALTTFGSDTETVLEILPPETPGSRSVIATVSSRPGTIFELPLKPALNFISLSELPLAVNDLRDPTLTNLNIQSLRGIIIQPATGAEILISRTPPRPWMATIEGSAAEANEERLFSLLKAVTESRAIGFESDAATDLTPWGLHRPFLKLRFLGQDNQGLELAFGIDGKGGYFVNRLGTPTVMRVDPSLVASIPVRPYEWRHARLWSLNRYNLKGIERISRNEPALDLRYIFKTEQWTVNQDGKDVTSRLDPLRANAMLSVLEGLKVNRWLSPTDESAITALAAPSLIFRVIETATNDVGDFTGLTTREIRLAPGSSGPNPGFYYGKLSSDTHPFLLDRETYNRLATNLLESP